MEYLNGKMEVAIKGNLKKIKFVGKEYLFGMTKVVTMDNGSIIQ